MFMSRQRTLWWVAGIIPLAAGCFWVSRAAFGAEPATSQPQTAYITEALLDAIPLWLLFVMVLAIVLVSIRLGYKAGKKRPQNDKSSEGAVVGAALGLLALILAFTFGIATGRYDTRRNLLLDEVESIGTTYLRAGLLAEPQGGEIRKLLREYVDLRVDLSADKLATMAARSEQLHDAMWAEITSLVAAGHKSAIEAVFINSLNQTIDLHNRRMAIGLHFRVPAVAWITLLGTTVIGMMMVGYLMGTSGDSNWILCVALAVIFSAIFTLTSDVDRPGEGVVQISKVPMQELQRTIQASQRSAGAGASSQPLR